MKAVSDLTEHDESSEAYWLRAIAHTLAYLSLDRPELRHKTTLQKAEFLQGLGLSIRSAADILGSTEASIKELQRQANRKKKQRGRKK